MQRLLIALFSLTIPMSLFALEGMTFSHNDWELTCDNTGTCRAAGYQEDDQDSLVSVLLTRSAGDNTEVTAEIFIPEEHELPAAPLTKVVEFHIDQTPHGTIKLKRGLGKLTPPQTRALLAALSQVGNIRFTSGKNTWKLSDTGASAVLRKMDDFQQRVGKPSALIAKATTESKDSSPTLQPVTAPVIKALIPQQHPPLSTATTNATPSSNKCLSKQRKK